MTQQSQPPELPTLDDAYRAQPLAMVVDQMHVRLLYTLMDRYELDIVGMLSHACSDWRSAWDLWSEFAEALPDPAVDGRGRIKPRSRKVVRKFAWEAAREFGVSGFCGMPAMWAAWLMEEHGVLCEVLANAKARRGG